MYDRKPAEGNTEVAQGLFFVTQVVLKLFAEILKINYLLARLKDFTR